MADRRPRGSGHRDHPPRPVRHHGAPYRFTALGVIRVRDDEIVRYDDYMDPIALARMLGRTRELATALSTT